MSDSAIENDRARGKRGAMLEETYPSGRMVRNTLNADADLSQVETKPSGGSYATRASNFVYSAAGGVSSLQLGNSKYETTQFNSRLQPTQIGLGTSTTDTSLLKLVYDYGTTTNNGNVQSQTITVPGMTYPLIQTYTYDSLDRLASATETSNSAQTWKQTFTYDRYGNRRFDESNTSMPSSFSNQAVSDPTVSTSNNRLTSSGYSYDNAGNTTADALGRTIVYDAENKQTSVSNSGGTIGTYYYDGDGKRVKKTSTSDSVIFLYDAAGKLIEERNSSTAALQTSYVYAGSRLLTTETSSGTEYLTADHLGSPRINTDASGNVIARHDYHPFGEEIGGVGGRTTGLNYGSDSVRKGFTGYEADGESGLDFAQARMYANQLGRFSQCDPIYVSKDHPVNPQKWNAYLYVVDNPLTYSDPTGLKPKQVIDVFIAYDQTDGEKAAWKKFKKDAKREGIKVNLFTKEKGTDTAAKFIESIQTKGHSVILMGHSYADADSLAKGQTTGTFHGILVEFNNSQISNKIYTIGDSREATDTVDGINANAKNIAVFTCDFGHTFDALGSTNKTNFFYLDNGKDGESALSKINAAGLAVAQGILNREKGEQLLKDANKAFNGIKTKYDEGDSVQRRVLSPVKNY